MCSICLGIRTGGIDVLPVVSSHCETIVLLSKLDSKNHISVELPMDEYGLNKC